MTTRHRNPAYPLTRKRTFARGVVEAIAIAVLFVGGGLLYAVVFLR
jgi:hypothetical protein